MGLGALLLRNSIDNKSNHSSKYSGVATAKLVFWFLDSVCRRTRANHMCDSSGDGTATHTAFGKTDGFRAALRLSRAPSRRRVHHRPNYNSRFEVRSPCDACWYLRSTPCCAVDRKCSLTVAQKSTETASSHVMARSFS